MRKQDQTDRTRMLHRHVAVDVALVDAYETRHKEPEWTLSDILNLTIEHGASFGMGLLREDVYEGFVDSLHAMGGRYSFSERTAKDSEGTILTIKKREFRAGGSTVVVESIHEDECRPMRNLYVKIDSPAHPRYEHTAKCKILDALVNGSVRKAMKDYRAHQAGRFETEPYNLPDLKPCFDSI